MTKVSYIQFQFQQVQFREESGLRLVSISHSFNSNRCNSERIALSLPASGPRVSIPTGAIQSTSLLLATMEASPFQFQQVQFRDGQCFKISFIGTSFNSNRCNSETEEYEKAATELRVSIPTGAIQSGLTSETMALAAKFQFQQVQFRVWGAG